VTNGDLNGTEFLFRNSFCCGSLPLVGNLTAAYAGEVVGLRVILNTYSGEKTQRWGRLERRPTAARKSRAAKPACYYIGQRCNGGE